MKVRITKEFNFEMAHALYGYDGPCKNIHGHSYKLTVSVIGVPETSNTSSKLGMVMDFSDLKKIVLEQIVLPFDHALVVNANSPHKNLSELKEAGKVILTEYQPTCENLLIDFCKKIQLKLPAHVRLINVKLQETESSCAEWHASDNL